MSILLPYLILGVISVIPVFYEAGGGEERWLAKEKSTLCVLTPDFLAGTAAVDSVHPAGKAEAEPAAETSDWSLAPQRHKIPQIGCVEGSRKPVAPRSGASGTMALIRNDGRCRGRERHATPPDADCNRYECAYSSAAPPYVIFDREPNRR